jgi:hypothetical protein
MVMGPVEVDTEWTVSEMSTARGCHQLGRRWQLSSSLLTVGMISMEQILSRRVEPTSREKKSCPNNFRTSSLSFLSTTPSLHPARNQSARLNHSPTSHPHDALTQFSQVIPLN